MFVHDFIMLQFFIVEETYRVHDCLKHAASTQHMQVERRAFVQQVREMMCSGAVLKSGSLASALD